MSKIGWAVFVVVAVITGSLTDNIALRAAFVGVYLLIALLISFFMRRRTHGKADQS